MYSSIPELEQKRQAKLDPKFVRLYLRARPEIELNVEEMQRLLQQPRISAALR